MKYAEFIVALKSSVEEKLTGSGEKVLIRNVIKNNDNMKDGLVIIKNEEKPSPTYYLDDMYSCYQAGADIDEIVHMILNGYDEQLCEGEDLLRHPSELENLEHVKNNITYKIFNREWNRHYLEDTAYIEYLDLAIVFYCTFITEEEGHVYSVKVSEGLMNEWHVDKDQLLKLAEKNTRGMLGIRIREINEILEDSFDMDDELKEAISNSERDPMYILSNNTTGYGAVNMLMPGVLSDIAEELDDDLYIIPSSVHEVILVPLNGRLRREEIDDMVKDINKSVVDSRDILADHVYVYNRQEDKITM